MGTFGWRPGGGRRCHRGADAWLVNHVHDQPGRAFRCPRGHELHTAIGDGLGSGGGAIKQPHRDRVADGRAQRCCGPRQGRIAGRARPLTLGRQEETEQGQRCEDGYRPGAHRDALHRGEVPVMLSPPNEAVTAVKAGSPRGSPEVVAACSTESSAAGGTTVTAPAPAALPPAAKAVPSTSPATETAPAAA